MLDEIADLKNSLAAKNKEVQCQRLSNDNLKKANQHLTEKVIAIKGSMIESAE
jgi:FtsZ-binding cell division protein ZapB